jgi:DNA-directed RNA polymerase specialized sigma24 family protein
VVNLSNSHHRRRRVERAYLAREGGALGTSAGSSGDPDVREDLWQAMRRLSARQRAAIVLRFYEDLSEQRVADILECRPGTVKSLVSRGLEVLRGEVRDEIRGG